MEQEVVTEVPQNLKRLTRLVVRGFYNIEHALVIDMLVRNPCMKEDDMLELLKFDRKQLRSALNSLKMDKFLKQRMRVETDLEGKTTRHNYYFINYQVFVNVVKFKLDHVRRKIEMEERDNTSRASFRCGPCQKTFTDLEADQLFDFGSQTFRCTICGGEVEEDESAIPKKDARTLLAKFNEEIQPIYDLLRECEDIKLAPELMEPEPTDMSKVNSTIRVSNSLDPEETDADLIGVSSGSKLFADGSIISGARGSHKPAEGERTTWSGDATKNKTFGYTESSVTISMNQEQTKDKEVAKEQPEWMTKSTVDGVPIESRDIQPERLLEPATSPVEQSNRSDRNDEIQKLLMIHEKKSSSGPAPVIPGASGVNTASDESDSSDSDMETPKPSAAVTADEEMESEEEEEVAMVIVGGMKVPLNEVTEEMVNKMTVEEKSEYIRLGKEMYEHMYE